MGKIKINFFLRPADGKAEKKSSKKERPILMYVSITYSFYCSDKGKEVTKTERGKFNTGEKIAPDYWSIKRQLPKESYVKAEEVCKNLAAVKKEAERVYGMICEKPANAFHDHSLNTFKAHYLKTHWSYRIPENKEPEKTPHELFYSKFDEFLEVQAGLQIAPRTIQKYKTTIQHLREYEQLHNKRLAFDEINLGFYNSYKAFMLKRSSGRISAKTKGEGLVNDTISKYISVIKTFMKWAQKMKYHNNEAYKDFEAKKKVKNEQIALTQAELNRVMELDLSNSKRLERVRDLFVFACHTGQRWSDVSTFNKKDVNGYTWHIMQAKGRNEVNIPLTLFSCVALSIAQKYNYELPTISDVKFNQYIKEVAQKAGINSMEKIRRLVGKRPVEILEPKYKFVSSHTARRTFITIALQNGVPPVTIMKITGHKDLRTLMKYEFIDESAVINAFSGVQLAAPAIKKAV